jgi:hypothetical protein
MKKCLTLLTLGVAVFASGCVAYPVDRYHYRDGPRYEHSYGDRYYRYHDRDHDHDHYHDGRAD